MKRAPQRLSTIYRALPGPRLVGGTAVWALLGYGIPAPAAILDPPAEAARVPQPEGADHPTNSGQNSELMLFDDVPTVISATRRASPINLAPMPVTIVPKEAVHLSGLTNLPEILQFYPGMDVLRLDRNNYAVGVHGFHHIFSDRTLVLIDGRNASSTFLGSIDLLSLPLLMEDVERVEVVRGPGGASWGANAFNGVINIITKEPGADPGLLVSTTLNHFGDTYTQIAWSQSSGPWGWRFSGGYEDREDSEDAIDSDDFSSRDFSRDARFRGDLSYKVSDDAKLTFGAAHSHVEQGGYGFAEFNPMRDERIELTRLYARFDHTVDATTAWYVQVFSNIEDSNRPQIARYHNIETDVDSQINFQPSDSHKVSLGGNVRWTRADPDASGPQQFTYVKDTYNEYWAGLFVIDQWDITRRFTLDTQLRGDYYSGTSSDWSGRLTALYALDDAKRHTLRFSGAKAFRAPLAGLRDATTHRLPLTAPSLPPGLFGVNVVPTPGAENEQIYSIEAGYYAKLTDQLTLRADGYFQRYEDLVGIVQPDPSLPIPVYTLTNNGGATAPGFEVELAYKAEGAGLSVWYAHNGFHYDNPGQDIRAFEPAPNKAGLTAHVNLTQQLTFTANYHWSDHTPVNVLSGENVRGYHRLDLTLAQTFAGGRGEILIGVKDVLDDTSPSINGVGSFQEHETPGRELFLRLQVKF